MAKDRDTEGLDAGEGVKLPLNEFVQAVAREAARTVMREHGDACPARMHIGSTLDRVTRIETKIETRAKFPAWLGAMIAAVASLIAIGSAIAAAARAVH